MTASVSLLLMQSISCLCEFSCDLSNLRRLAIPPLGILTQDLGNAHRPSNNRTSRRSTSRMVSRTHLSSPCRAFWIASGSPALNKSWKHMKWTQTRYKFSFVEFHFYALFQVYILKCKSLFQIKNKANIMETKFYMQMRCNSVRCQEFATIKKRLHQ